MRLSIKQLNEMSFQLPEGWSVSNDVYDLPNGQGMRNVQNYVSSRGEVISLFVVARDPEEFLEAQERAAKNPDKVASKYSLIACPSIKSNGFIFPAYIVCGHGEQELFMVQVFVNCGDCLGCFIVNTQKFSCAFGTALKKIPVLQDLVKILKTVE